MEPWGQLGGANAADHQVGQSELDLVLNIRNVRGLAADAKNAALDEELPQQALGQFPAPRCQDAVQDVALDDAKPPHLLGSDVDIDADVNGLVAFLALARSRRRHA